MKRPAPSLLCVILIACCLHGCSVTMPTMPPATATPPPTATPHPTPAPDLPFIVAFSNRSGPTVEVAVRNTSQIAAEAKIAATVPCGDGVELVQGPDLPALPWVVDIQLTSGSLILGQTTAYGDRIVYLTLMGYEVAVTDFPLAGPPVPCPSSP